MSPTSAGAVETTRTMPPVRPWPGRADRAHVVWRERGGGTLDEHGLRRLLAGDRAGRWLAELHGAGYRSMRTNAVTPAVATVLAEHGFHVAQELVLLHHPGPLGRSRAPRDRRVRTWRPVARRADALSTLDRAAFGDEWWLDAAGILDACAATPASRVRVLLADGRPLGYCLTGRAGAGGYVQRLAVVPAEQGGGVGALLVADALAWLARHRVGEVHVNTHTGNEPALRLYRRAGFHQRDEGLVVMDRELP